MALQNKIFRNIKILKGSSLFESLSQFGEERTRKLTTLSFSLITLSIFGIFAINPTLSTIAGLRRELDDKKFVDQRLQEKITNLSTLYQKYAEVQNDIPIITAAVPKTPEVPTLVAIVQAVGKDSNINVTSIQTFQVEAVSQLENSKNTTFSFSVSSEGAYQDLLRFTKSLSNSQRIISLDNISINRKTGNTGLLQLDLRGSAYFKE